MKAMSFRNVVAGLLAVTGLCVSPCASGSLQVFPTRVLLTETSPSAQLSVRNRSAKPTNYKVNLVFYVMKPDGSMELVPDPKGIEVSAIDNIKFSPRKVTLRPDEEQVVRVLSSRVAALKDGEYRAHLYFESMDEPEDIPIGQDSTSAAQLFLKARMAVAVPIVIRRGQTMAKTELTEPKIVTMPDKSYGFSVRMKKEGNRNLYGDFKVIWKTTDGQEREVGIVRGVSSYIAERLVMFPLQVQDANLYKSGTLKVQFLTPQQDGSEMLAEVKGETLTEPTATVGNAAPMTDLSSAVPTQSSPPNIVPSTSLVPTVSLAPAADAPILSPTRAVPSGVAPVASAETSTNEAGGALTNAVSPTPASAAVQPPSSVAPVSPVAPAAVVEAAPTTASVTQQPASEKSDEDRSPAAVRQ